jgi:hypothetical protein
MIEFKAMCCDNKRKTARVLQAKRGKMVQKKHFEKKSANKFFFLAKNLAVFLHTSQHMALMS